MQVLERPTIVHHAVVDLAARGATLARWLAVLPPRRQMELAACDAAARIASLLGMALLASCARAAGVPLAWSGLRFPEGGKPSWDNGGDFSIAHAGDRVACALAPQGVEVGLDLEACAGVTLESLRLVTSGDERALVASGRLDAASLWTRKEAVLKAAGRGIRDVGAVRVGADEGELDGRGYALLDVPLAPGYACTIALRGRPTAIAVAERGGAALLAAGP